MNFLLENFNSKSLFSGKELVSCERDTVIFLELLVFMSHLPQKMIENTAKNIKFYLIFVSSVLSKEIICKKNANVVLIQRCFLTWI